MIFKRKFIYPSATIYDAGGRTGAMDRAIKPLSREMRLFGPAYTVRCAPGDNLALHRSLSDSAIRGHVLVIATSEGRDGSYCGELIALAAQSQGARGIILDGYVRDSDQLRRMGFPIFCRGAAHVGAVKNDEGERSVPVVCGGVTVEPGQLIAADGDGVVAVALGREVEVLLKADRALHREKQIKKLVTSGVSVLDSLSRSIPTERNSHV